MAKEWTEKDVEILIRDSSFTNPEHKEALRGKLSEPAVLELCTDDLEMAAGGVKLPEPFSLPWHPTIPSFSWIRTETVRKNTAASS